MISHIRIVGDRCNIVLGTHNEKSALNAASIILQSGIKPESHQVVFGQIYGMADQISVPLAVAGFKVKSVKIKIYKYLLYIVQKDMSTSYYFFRSQSQ